MLHCEIDFGQSASPPTQRQMSAMLLLVDRDDDFLKYGAKEFFLVSWQGGWSPPNGGQVSTQCEQAATLIGAERLRSQCFAMGKLGLGPIEFAQGFLPLSLETASDKTIIRIDGAIATLGALRFVACPFHRETPLRERTVMVGFEPLGRGNCRLDTDGRERGEHGPFNRFVNLQRTDGEAVDAATIGDVLAGAMIARGCSATRVVSAQPTTATSADCDALQQGSSFSHGAAPC